MLVLPVFLKEKKKKSKLVRRKLKRGEGCVCLGEKWVVPGAGGEERGLVRCRSSGQAEDCGHRGEGGNHFQVGVGFQDSLLRDVTEWVAACL